VEEPTKVLVIDNDPEFADTMKMALQKKFGAEVSIAEDCTSARSILSSSSFDLITLDYLLPESTGVDFLNEIRPTLGFTRVVMLTGRGDEKTAAEAYRAGAVGYIIKERDFSTVLLSILERAIDQSRV
jgi:DNA-binding NtrC family response regulator